MYHIICFIIFITIRNKKILFFVKDSRQLKIMTNKLFECFNQNLKNVFMIMVL